MSESQTALLFNLSLTSTFLTFANEDPWRNLDTSDEQKKILFLSLEDTFKATARLVTLK